MTISELLDAAKRKQGSLGAVADGFGFHQSRLSEWRSGKRKPNATEIMVLSEMAGLPPFETLAQIEQELDEKHASVWARALGNLRAAGVAATVILTLGTCLTPSHDASAASLSGSESTLSARTSMKTGLLARFSFLPAKRSTSEEGLEWTSRSEDGASAVAGPRPF